MEPISGSGARDVLMGGEGHRTLSEKIVEGNIALNAGETTQEVNISNCIFKGSVIITGGDHMGLDFHECVFESAVVIVDGDFRKLRIRDCKLSRLDLLGGIFRSEVIIAGCAISKLRIEGKPEITQMLVFSSTETHHNGQPISLPFDIEEQDTIEEVRLSSGCGRVRFASLKIQDFVLKGVFELEDSLELYKLDLQKLSIREVKNRGEIIIEESHPKQPDNESRLSFIESSLGVFSLINMELNLFKVFHVTKCNLLGIGTDFVLWPKDVESETEHGRLIAYRQLKMLAREEGNRPDELNFTAKEKGVYLQILKTAKGSLRDRFILWTSSWSNKFGQSWATPIVWLFVFNFPIYILVTLLSGICICDHLGEFFSFLIPTHKIDFLGQSITGWALVFDFASRIISSYFYYQIITGFRKYSRSNF